MATHWWEEREVLKRCRGKLLDVHLGGPMSFGAANEMGRRLGPQVPFEVLILDLSDVPLIDSSAALAVEEIIECTIGGQRRVLVVELKRPR